MGDGGPCKIICAICYEDAKPASEELQTISLCGHVFHELCLQQWLEYCPRGKYTCPLCKRHCANKDVHRLYFQSATEVTQACQETGSEPPFHGDHVENLQETVHKLTGQLLVTKSSLEACQEQLQESNKQLSVCLVRAQQAESAQAEANKENSKLKCAISKKREELEMSAAEQFKLLERNSYLTKELASVNLTQNLDVDEDEVARMARIGGSNKDDVINTLTRSLIVRNRAYKDLMAKCNELGTGENKALRQCEKAAERMKALKARILKLERCLEDKENGTLKVQKAPKGHGHSDNGIPIVPLKTMNGSLGTSKPPLPLQPSCQSMQTFNEHLQNTNSLSVTRDRSRVHKDGVFQLDDLIKSSATNHVITDNVSKDTDHSIGINESSIYFPESPSDKSKSASAQQYCDTPDKTYEDLCSDELNGLQFPVTIRKEVRFSSATIGETGTTASICDNIIHTSKWCKQTSACAETGGTFISLGANGRGGQVKVLRPAPLLKIGGTSCDNWLRSAKKMKSTRSVQQAGSQQGSLHIEHFFGGA